MTEYATLMAEAKMWGVMAWISTVAAVVLVSWAITLVLKLRKINKAIDQNDECIGRLEDDISRASSK